MSPTSAPLAEIKSYLEQAVDLAGGQRALADKLTLIMESTVTQQTVWNWLHRNRTPLDGKYVIPIEKAVDGKITRFQLRPDLYPLVERV